MGFGEWLGGEHELNIPCCLPHNGLTERKNRTLIEIASTMLSDADLLKRFWDKTILTATYLANRLLTKTNNNKIPFELWNERKVNLYHLRIFGCNAYK